MKKNNLIFLVVSIAISFVGIVTLTRPGFFLTDDGNSMIIRFSAFYEAIRHGQLPVRFLSRLNQGYGYPVADFLYPLFMYIAVPIKALGFSFVNSIKIVFAISFLLGTTFSYLWLKKLFDEKSALVGSLAYSLFPYHLFDMYIRGSVGEALALGVIPFIFWSIERGNLFLVSIGYFLLITAHNSLALIFLPIIFIYHLFKEKLSKVLLTFLLGLGLSSFFVFPALYDKQFTVFDLIKISDYAKYFLNIQSTILLGLISAITFLFALIFIQKKNTKFLFFSIVLVVSVFLSSSLSSFLWAILPLANLIQFPFRFLSLAIPAVSFLAAYEVFHYKAKLQKFFIIFIISIIFVSARGFLLPLKFENYPDTFYSTNLDSTTVKNEYMPKWIKKTPSKIYSAKVENLNGKEKINIKNISPSKIQFDVYLASAREIRVNTVYFPGWTAYVNGFKWNIIYDNGFIDLKLNKGQNSVVVSFGETKFRLFADYVSLISFIVLLYLLIKKNVKFF